MKQNIKLILTAVPLILLLNICGSYGQTIIHEPDGRFGYDTAAHQEVNYLIAKDSACEIQSANDAQIIADYKQSDLNHIAVEANLNMKVNNSITTINGLNEIIILKDGLIDGFKKQLKDANSNPDWWRFGIGGVVIGLLTYFIAEHYIKK